MGCNDFRGTRRTRVGPPRSLAPHRVVLAGGVVAAAALAACGDGTLMTDPAPEPDQKQTAQLSILVQDVDAPPLLTSDTTFIATRGEELEIELFYEDDENPGIAGEEFLEFELDAESLLRYPPSHPRAGELFQDGDTITIRITVDPAQLIATMEPTGIEFDPQEPAELEIRYSRADDDYDGDGDDDPPENEGRIDLWRQESPGDPWERVGRIKDAEFDRVRALLTSFSRYALAI